MSKKTIFGGVAGGFLAICCAGLPIGLSILTGLGLGFIINDFILVPLLIVTLGLMFLGLHHNKKKHLNSKPFQLAIFSAIVVFIGVAFTPIIWFGVIGLIFSTIWDYIILRRSNKC